MSYYDIESVTCPKCGFEQPESPECANCGIIFDKWKAQKQADALAADSAAWGGGDVPPPARRPQRVSANPLPAVAPPGPSAGAWGDAPPPQPGPSREPEVADDDDEMLSGVGIGSYRLLLGLGSAGAATWLALAVNPLDNYTVMAIIAITAALFIWTLLSFKQEVTPRQVVFETLLAVVVAAGVVVTMPGLVDDAPPSTGQPTVDKPKKEPAVAEVPKSPLGDFARAAEDYTEAVDELLQMDGAAPHVEWDALTPRLEFETVRSAHEALSERDRGEALSTWEKVKPVPEVVAELLRDWKKPSEGGFSFSPTKIYRDRARETASQARAAVQKLSQELKVIR